MFRDFTLVHFWNENKKYSGKDCGSKSNVKEKGGRPKNLGARENNVQLYSIGKN